MNKKFLIFIVLFAWIQISYANNIQLHLIHIGTQTKLVKNIADKAIQQSHTYWQNKIKNLDITISLNHKKSTNSLSNLNTNFCKININYQNLKPVILSTFKDDLTFMLWHEISHCMLGKNILLNNYNWITIHNQNEISQLNIKIDQRTDDSLRDIHCIQCENNNFKIAPPMVAYHEMFADTQASMWWIQQNKNINELKLLFLKRLKYYQENPKGETHISNFDIPIILAKRKNIYKMNQQNIFLEAKKITEIGFIKYLKNI
jgi:hypothetical protein